MKNWVAEGIASDVNDFKFITTIANVMKPMELDVEVHSSAGSSQTGSSNFALAGNGTNHIQFLIPV